jgi:single-stranded-DNA-specific exonuclease
MPEQLSQWQVQPTIEPPEWLIKEVRRHAPDLSGNYAAQLLWQRGIRDAEQLPGFLNQNLYKPASAFEFGIEMRWAVERLQQARSRAEIIAIWGDFDADGITATSVLWDGLGQFFTKNSQLIYYIPNRLTESHGLNRQGIDLLASQECKLIVTCDTGSTNISEIEYARSLGIDTIVTDHHTLPDERPPVTAIINPRYLSVEHPLYHLSGVAVAYKLIEALYETLPDIPNQPLDDLLDLVAIGLIADLVQLSGDCRYLAQRGIERLQLQSKTQNSKSQINRPGVAKLLELCQRSGDRPTDISFGIGPRINAVSRIQGDASFCVELLTSQDEKRCEELAYDAELANSRRKSLQKDVVQQVKVKIAQLDLSTTSVIVLVDEQWPAGVLGLVAGQVAQEYGRPTILLSTDDPQDAEESKIPFPGRGPELAKSKIALARGSARSVNGIDLYKLVKDQAHLLHRFGGHPMAAGLSIPVENVPLFAQAINQQVKQLNVNTGLPVVQADIVCKVRELGKDLFRELKLLEPCGMGNPAPKILIQNCWFDNIWNRNSQDFKGRKVQYIKTELEIWDDSADIGFPGIWWGHYKDEVPADCRCDAIAELDFNTYKKRYEIRLIAVKPSAQSEFGISSTQLDWILDWRAETPEADYSVLMIKECPSSWDELQMWFRRAIAANQKLAIAYPPPEINSPTEIWQQLIGIAKYLARTGSSATLAQLHEKLGISDRALRMGLQALSHLGFEVTSNLSEVHTEELTIQNSRCDKSPSLETHNSPHPSQFLAAVREEQFIRQYFYQVPLSTLQAMTHQTIASEV